MQSLKTLYKVGIGPSSSHTMGPQYAAEYINAKFPDAAKVKAEEAKALYPSLDLDTETKNPQFRKLLMAGIDVATAYHVIHKDEILPAAMQHTARVVEQKLVNSVRAGGKRPSENGASGQSPSLVKSDVTKLTSADRREIRRRVLAGEKIRF